MDNYDKEINLYHHYGCWLLDLSLLRKYELNKLKEIQEKLKIMEQQIEAVKRILNK